MSKPNPSAESLRAIKVEVRDEKETKEKIAQLYTASMPGAATAMMNVESIDQLDINLLLAQLREQSQKVRKGDLGGLEAMLVSQAYVLNKVFTKNVSKMAASQYLDQYKVFSAMAFKAQSLCTRTVATLAEMKNPNRTTFIKNTAVNQQVNMGEGISNEFPEKNFEKLANELISETPPQLEHQHHETLDIGGTAAPGGTDKTMAAVAESRS